MNSHLPVLMYHAVEEGRSVLATSPSVFAWQMGWLKKNRFRVISLDEAGNCLRQNLGFPSRAVAITFDDGFESVYQHAFPVLSQNGFPATVFLVADYVGRENTWPGQPAAVKAAPLASWDQIQEMDRSGIQFGSHSLTHPRLDQLSAAELHRQVIGSQSIIAERLGHEVRWFAYPYGRLTEKVKEVVRQAYDGACSASLGVVNMHSNIFAFERVETYYLQDPRIFKLLAGNGIERYLSLRRIIRQGASWALRRSW